MQTKVINPKPITLWQQLWRTIFRAQPHKLTRWHRRRFLDNEVRKVNAKRGKHNAAVERDRLLRAHRQAIQDEIGAGPGPGGITTPAKTVAPVLGSITRHGKAIEDRLRAIAQTVLQQRQKEEKS